jgi:hypothetical protein
LKLGASFEVDEFRCAGALNVLSHAGGLGGYGL